MSGGALGVVVVGLLLTVRRPRRPALLLALLALLALGLTDAAWSACSRLGGRERVDSAARTPGRPDARTPGRPDALREPRAPLPAAAPYVAVRDGTQLPRCTVPRCSRTMPGTAWLKNPRPPPGQRGSPRAQRYLHLAARLPRCPAGPATVGSGAAGTAPPAAPLRRRPTGPARAAYGPSAGAPHG